MLGRRYDVDAVFEGVRIAGVHGSEDRCVHFDDKGHVADTTRIALAYRGETRTVQLDVAPGTIFVVDAAR